MPNNKTSEGSFRIFLIIGSEVVENTSNENKRASIAHQINGTESVIKKKSRFLGECEKYNEEYVEYEALLGGIEDMERNMPVRMIDLRVWTDNPAVVDQLNGQVNSDELDGLNKLAKRKLSMFQSCEIEHVPESESDQVQLVHAHADSAFFGGGTEHEVGTGNGLVGVETGYDTDEIRSVLSMVCNESVLHSDVVM